MRARCKYLALGIASLGLLLVASSTADAQMMVRPSVFVAPRPFMTSRVFVAPSFFFPPRVVYYPPYYPRTYYAPTYSYPMPYGSGYGSYRMPYGSYQMPYSSFYSSDYGPNSYPSSSRTLTDINVVLYDNYFQPNQITVPVGATVRWTNSGRHHHTVTSDTGLWDSGELSSGQSFDHTFTTSGTYPYHCTIHAKEMRGVVIVK
jgi:plastocyanin